MQTTIKQFDLYKQTAKEWIKKWGLASWEVHVMHMNNDMESLATCQADPPGRTALLTFTKYIGKNEGLTDERIKMAGFHETCELLLAPLVIACRDPKSREDELDSIRHGIIRRLEDVIFGDNP